MSADTNDFIERIPHDRAHAVKGPDAVAQPHPEAGEIYLEFMNSGNDAIFRLFPEFPSSKFLFSLSVSIGVNPWLKFCSFLIEQIKQPC